GADEGEGDAEEPLPGPGPEVLGRLVQGGVEVGEAGGRVEEEDGVEVQGLDDDDAEELGRAEDVPVDAEDLVERALASEDCAHAESAHERGEDEWDEHGRVQGRLEREAVLGAEDRQGEGDQGAE